MKIKLGFVCGLSCPILNCPLPPFRSSWNGGTASGDLYPLILLRRTDDSPFVHSPKVRAWQWT